MLFPTLHHNRLRSLLYLSLFCIALLMGMTGATVHASDQPSSAKPDISVHIGDLVVKYASAYYWRDWMPEVDKPGLDGGSPLYSSIELIFDNSAGTAIDITVSIQLLDENGQKLNADFFTDLISETRPASIQLAAGESQTIVFESRNGPYIDADSKVSARIRLETENNCEIIRLPLMAVDKTA